MFLKVKTEIPVCSTTFQELISGTTREIVAVALTFFFALNVILWTMQNLWRSANNSWDNLEKILARHAALSESYTFQQHVSEFQRSHEFSPWSCYHALVSLTNPIPSTKMSHRWSCQLWVGPDRATRNWKLPVPQPCTASLQSGDRT